jgi:hypothetical protein
MQRSSPSNTGTFSMPSATALGLAHAKVRQQKAFEHDQVVGSSCVTKAYFAFNPGIRE